MTKTCTPTTKLTPTHQKFDQNMQICMFADFKITQTIYLNTRSAKGYWSHTKHQGETKMALQKHRLYELAQMFSMIDLLFGLF